MNTFTETAFNPTDATKAEKKVLGALLLDPERIVKQAPEVGIKSKHFGSPIHAKAWGFLYGRASKGETIDLKELPALCPKELEEFNGTTPGLNLLQGWLFETPTAHHFKEHAGKVIEAQNRRDLNEQIRKATEVINSGESIQYATEIMASASTLVQSTQGLGKSLTDKLDDMIASTTEHLEEMEKLSKETVFILPDIAISGQITLINASPNAGKTLLTSWLLSRRDQQARESHKVYYINADDTYDGGRFKAEFLKQHGVETLLPDQFKFSVAGFKGLIEDAIAANSCDGVVFILDTLKKFVDMMDKKAARSWNDLLRRFVQCGGTIIALAHVNKNKDGDGSSVAEGVGDFMNDFDAAYVIEVAGESESGERTVVFKNTKSRGPNTKKATFTYSNAEKETWLERFESVSLLNHDQATRNIAKAKAEKRHAEDKPVIDYICQRLEGQALSRTDICQSDLSNGFSRSRRDNVLSRYSTDNGGENKVYWEASKNTTGGWTYSLV